MTTTTLAIVGLVVLAAVVGLLWTVRFAAMQARRTVDRLGAVRDRVVPLAEQLQRDAEHAAARREALGGERDA